MSFTLMTRKTAHIGLFLLFGLLIRTAAFQADNNKRDIPKSTIQLVADARVRSFPSALALNSNNKNEGSSNKSAVYKDDCFGLTSFIGGLATRDFVFTGIFVILSVTADVITRQGYFPVDPQKPFKVDRKVPGVIASLTLLLTPIITETLVENGSWDATNVVPEARSVQLAICSFSMITAFLDIRWRDGFGDY